LDEIVQIGLAEITKTEKTPEGTLLVYGKAAGDGLDLDGQRLDMTWLKSAMPEWMTTGANVREMHQPIAAGKGLQLEEKDGAFHVLSEAVDPVTITKLEKGVLTGYSVGIKKPQVIKDASAPNGRIVGGKIIELSYADRPSDPTNKVAIVKTAGDGELAPTEQLKTVEETEEAEKAVTADQGKDAWDAAIAGETVGRLRALRDQLGYPPKDSDTLIAAVLDALVSLAYTEESEAIEETGDMALYSVHPDLTKRTFYSTAEKERVTTALKQVVAAAQAVVPDIANQASEEAGEGDETPPETVTVVEEELAGSAKTATPDETKGTGSGDDTEQAEFLTKVVTGDTFKAFLADTFKAALADGLTPVKEEQAKQAETLDKLADVPDRLDKVEEMAAPTKVALHVQDRGSSVDDFTQTDPLSALTALKNKHQGLADGSGDPILKQAHVAKVAEIDRAIAAMSSR
jgi:hypothetical protein